MIAKTSPVLADIAYSVTFSTGGNSQVKNMLKAASQLVGEANCPPPTETALRRRMEQDAEHLRQVLRDEGYYAAKLEFACSTSPPSRRSPNQCRARPSL